MSSSRKAVPYPPLQPGAGAINGEHYVEATEDTVSWGWIPGRDARPVLTVEPGALVTFDTVSHEGILEDQGRDPDRFFGEHGVAASDVLRDARLVAAEVAHDFRRDGPHVVLGPVYVDGADPGDLLKIDVVELVPRVSYGVISNRHGRGVLAGEFPEHTTCHPDASHEHPERFGSVSVFTPIEHSPRGATAVIPFGDDRAARFPIHPFMGIMAVAGPGARPLHSVPPGAHGGNVDLNLLTEGSTLYLPVHAPGALFSVGDPHYAQGDGEVALTALEAPLRATFRLSIVSPDDPLHFVDRPFAEDDERWVVLGLHRDVDEAARDAVRHAVAFLERRVGMDRALALAYLSAAADLEITQMVDQVNGVHCIIRKSDFA